MDNPAKDSQARYLQRRLSLRLFISWVIYTAVFGLLVFILNFTLVPKLADIIADETSEWSLIGYDEYPLDKCLEVLDYELLGTVEDFTDGELIAQRINGDYEFDEKVAEVAEENFSDEALGSVEAESLKEVYVVEDSDAQKPATVDGDTFMVYSFTHDDFTEETIGPENPVLMVKGEGEVLPVYLEDLQEQAIMLDTGGFDSYRWQTIFTEDGVMIRDLSAYRVIKQFKWPVIIGLYLVGCIGVIFLSYGRAVSYFGELSGAVGDLLANRTKPVTLSRDLAITENELNTLRLNSLADERTASMAERRKDELVAYLAHDIKTPLTSVMGYLMLLSEAPDMPADIRQRYIETASGKAQRLESLIDEFFEITRYNLQAIPIERMNVDVRLLCEQVADEFYPDAQAKAITIEVKAPEDAQWFVDPDKLARALGNVMRNAVAHGAKDSSITLEVTAVAGGIDGETPGWSVTVTNFGREISPMHLESIFEKFYREDSSRGSSEGRSGLGLAIAKEIVEAHGGTIKAESSQGKTTFTVFIP